MGLLQNGLNFAFQQVEFIRFDYKGGRAECKKLVNILLATTGGVHEDRDGFEDGIFLEMLKTLFSIHFWHVQVQKNVIWLWLGRLKVQQRFDSVYSRYNLKLGSISATASVKNSRSSMSSSAIKMVITGRAYKMQDIKYFI